MGQARYHEHFILIPGRPGLLLATTHHDAMRAGRTIGFAGGNYYDRSNQKNALSFVMLPGIVI
jgi:hypothetical protein